MWVMGTQAQTYARSALGHRGSADGPEIWCLVLSSMHTGPALTPTPWAVGTVGEWLNRHLSKYLLLSAWEMKEPC